MDGIRKVINRMQCGSVCALLYSTANDNAKKCLHLCKKLPKDYYFVYYRSINY